MNGRLIAALLAGHIIALLFGVAGLLIAVPNPDLWADSAFAVRVYQFGMQWAGAVHILFATGAMLLAGAIFLGWRKVLWFLLIASIVSLSAELMGTMTGFPFGEYSYTAGLGYKILDEVPFTIPLSWFYMGLAAYVLGHVLVGRGLGWWRSVAAVFAGSVLLTVWDLVLDPAMAHQSLDVRFWVWHQDGIYFDMPAQNFLGWLATGFVFIGLSRFAWGEDPPLSAGLLRTSFVVYIANLIFAMAISAGVGLWWPVLITVFVGLIPALIALVSAEASPGQGSGVQSQGSSAFDRVARNFLTLCARLLLARQTSVRVTGTEHLPETGPALLIARHYHHLLDGCVFYARLPRTPKILVAVDWASEGWKRRLLMFACRSAGWPTVIRPDHDDPAAVPDEHRFGLLRDALLDSVALLRNGELLVVFPEGHPTIDPHRSVKTSPEELLAFDHGFVALARAAERDLGARIPIIPVGFHYQSNDQERWEIDMNLGAPLFLDQFTNARELADELRARVTDLSGLAMYTGRSAHSTVRETS